LPKTYQRRSTLHLSRLIWNNGPRWVENILALGVAMIYNYSLHRMWTFKFQQPHPGSAPRYVLVVVIASYNGGGSGTFYTLHILDIEAARAFDLEGKVYSRINLTSVRSVVLGDRWDGEVSISKNSIVVVTIRGGPVGGAARHTMSIVAKRP
jgi:hypothetical protein